MCCTSVHTAETGLWRLRVRSSASTAVAPGESKSAEQDSKEFVDPVRCSAASRPCRTLFRDVGNQAPQWPAVARRSWCLQRTPAATAAASGSRLCIGAPSL